MNKKESEKLAICIKEYGKDLGMAAYLRWKCETDLYFLAYEILGLKNAVDTKSGRRKRIDPKIHKRMARELQDPNDSLHLYARGMMKSTFMQIRIVQSTIQNPYSRRGYWSATQNLVRDNLKIVTMHLTNPELMRIYPEVIPPRDKWEKDTNDVLTVYRDPKEGPLLRENQVEVYGITSNVTGRHYDEHYYDDVINEKSVTSPEMLHKTRTWWDMMQAVKDADASEKMIGTYYHQQDIYNMIESEGYFPVITKLPAMVGADITYKFFTKKYLAEKKKRMTPYNFSCQYLLNPIPDDDRMFLPPYTEYETLPEDAEYYITLDPAATTGKYSDKSGIAVACIDPKSRGRLYIVEAKGYKEQPDVIADILVRKIAQYHPRRVGIEYGLQRSIQFIIDTKIKEWEQAHKETLTTAFVPISTGRDSKADKINRTIGVMHRDGRVLYNRLQCAELLRQMGTFNPNVGGNQDDVLDAAAMLVMTCPYFAQGHWYQEQQTEIMDHFTVERMMKMARDKHGQEWQKLFAC